MGQIDAINALVRRNPFVSLSAAFTSTTLMQHESY